AGFGGGCIKSQNIVGRERKSPGRMCLCRIFDCEHPVPIHQVAARVLGYALAAWVLDDGNERGAVIKLELLDHLGFSSLLFLGGGSRLSRKPRRRRQACSLFLSSHSQKVPTSQPRAFKSVLAARSRFRFPSIFPTQYARLALGTRAPRAQSCPCQKQPCTKM